LSTQAKTDPHYYLHDEIGYNYRMTNLQAALGVAQLEELPEFIRRKQQNYDLYCELFDGFAYASVMPFRTGTRSNHWFYSLLLPDRLDRDDVIARLQAQQIQTRPVWSLIPEQCDYARNEAYALDQAKEFRRSIVNIPCSTNLTEEDCNTVIDAILAL
jgi:dTDP-4-amino-4,6-dideoxygalactose transaminase